MGVARAAGAREYLEHRECGARTRASDVGGSGTYLSLAQGEAPAARALTSNVGESGTRLSHAQGEAPAARARTSNVGESGTLLARLPDSRD